jgi:trimeric autotransporter adhesin
MKNFTRALCTGLCTMLLALPAAATPPKTLSYQGVLTNAAAVPVNGAQTIVFSLYDAATAGNLLWSESQGVNVANGLFSVTLGAGTPLTLAFDVPYFLGVKVGADAEMSPRQPLASSAYAFKALGLDASATVSGSAVVGPISAVTGTPISSNTAIGASALSAFTPLANSNTAIGAFALHANQDGGYNTAIGDSAQLNNLSANANTAIGRRALYFNQAGSGNTGVGFDALFNASGNNNIAIGKFAGDLLTSGSDNIAIGNQGVAGESGTIRLGDPAVQTQAFIAGIRNITPVSSDVLPVIIDVNGQLGTSSVGATIREPGANNTFAGTGAGNATVAGDGNVAFGRNALPAVTTGIWNASTGYRSMLLNQGGSFNTANGLEALANNVSGSNNTAVGVRALLNSNAGNNIAIGANAGSSLTSGGGNIAIDHVGVAAEANTIRIGTGQTRAFVAGISGITSSGGVQVFINSAGQLGTLTSSARFKENIASMDDASADLMRLNPVTFNYLDGQDDGQKLTQYGLIAEEVAEVYPDLVVKTPDGKAETVRYHFLTPMLLNEVQKQQRKLQSQAETIDALKQELRAIRALLGAGNVTHRKE